MLMRVPFLEIDISDQAKLADKLAPFDVIVHTAGPFQGLRDPIVMRTALQQGKKYLDVCDDVELSRISRAQSLQQLAEVNNKSFSPAC